MAQIIKFKNGRDQYIDDLLDYLESMIPNMKDFVCVYTDKEGEICYLYSESEEFNVSDPVYIVGMMEYAKKIIMEEVEEDNE